MPSHELAPPPVTTVDVYSPSRTPVLTVDPGDTTVVGSLDAYGCLVRQKFPGQQRMFMVPRGHCSSVDAVLPDWILA
jgi:hypothetical protein